MDHKYLTLTQDGNVGVITISRPKALNALNRSVLKELSNAIDQLEKNKDVYVIVLTGEGKSFVAGADIAEMKDMTPEEAKSFGQWVQKSSEKLRPLPNPLLLQSMDTPWAEVANLQWHAT